MTTPALTQEPMLREHFSLRHSKEPPDDVAKAFVNFKFGVCQPAAGATGVSVVKSSKAMAEAPKEVSSAASHLPEHLPDFP